MIRVNSSGKPESTTKDLHTTQKSHVSISQIESSKKTISGEIASKSPDVHLQFRGSSEKINEAATTGESSPGHGVQIDIISSKVDGENSGGINSDTVTGAPIDNGDKMLQKESLCDVNELSKVTEPLNQQRINIGILSNLQDQVTMKAIDRNKEEERDSMRRSNMGNQAHNHEKECTQTQKEKVVQYQHEEPITNGSTNVITEAEKHGKVQGDQGIAQHTQKKASIEISKEKQYGKEERTFWRVKDKTNLTENITHHSKEEGETHININGKERPGQSDTTIPIKYDQNNSVANNSHKSQNEHEKGQSVVQAGDFMIEDQSRKTTQNVLNVDSKIPSPIKVSSNFDTYRPNHQRTSQTSPKHNQNRPHGNTVPLRNVSHQIPDPAPPIVTQSLASRLRANQIKNANPLDITTPIITTR
ncbi:hypothetical protein RDI58_019856 [Solanum bulbocastanum]|uniref:Uncharacterized protein n=1 Tax=Solanum bulbocastanum TaxID=147425 RepID=A0AAN8T5H5_SOLBU